MTQGKLLRGNMVAVDTSWDSFRRNLRCRVPLAVLVLIVLGTKRTGVAFSVVCLREMLRLMLKLVRRQVQSLAGLFDMLNKLAGYNSSKMIWGVNV